MTKLGVFMENVKGRFSKKIDKLDKLTEKLTIKVSHVKNEYETIIQFKYNNNEFRVLKRDESPHGSLSKSLTTARYILSKHRFRRSP